MSARESIERFGCFGGSCGVIVAGDAPAASAAAAASRSRDQLLEWHERFSRFLACSELSELNADPRAHVPASPVMVHLAGLARHAAELTGGLVDATLLGQIEASGYADALPPALPLPLALGLAPARRAAGPSRESRWRLLSADHRAGTVSRPPGLALDSGGLAKGLFADLIAESLSAHESFAVDCGGDLAIGGYAGAMRPVEVQSPFDGSVLHTFELAHAGVATSGIGRRAWLGADGRPAHHLLDPSTGRAAFTGIVQATALAPSAALAEIHAKAAVLSGPDGAASWLRWGGAIVLDDGSHHVLEPAAAPGRAPEAGLAVAA